MTILWESLTEHPGTVRFGRDGQLDERLGPVLPLKMVGISGARQTNFVTRMKSRN
jgi:hypothetical protein